MLSILIPTYNVDCLRLVTDLHQQCEELQAQFGATTFDYEILVADDAGTDTAVIERNELMECFDNTRYIRLQHNCGRALVCNFLFDEAHFDHLLLMDADAEVCSESFLYDYWMQRTTADVLVGSIRTPDTAPRGHELRLKYEHAAHRIRTTAYRNAHPAAHFSTFNVLFSRRAIEQVHFDNRCTEYGYEDALMGYTLVERGFSIRHIDNPLLHIGINSNESFLRNTETALRVLRRLGPPLTDHAHIARLHTRLSRLSLLPLLRCWHRTFASFERRNLLSRRPLLWVFNLYKLGCYATLTTP